MNKRGWMKLLMFSVLSVLLYGGDSAEAQPMSDSRKQGTSSPTPPTRPDPYREYGVGEPVNPGRCKTGKKSYVYWAARDQVFAFRYDPTKPVYPRSGNKDKYDTSKNVIPPAPDPGEPEGCYGNPLRGGEVPYMRHHSAELFRKLAGRELNTSANDGNTSHQHYAMTEIDLSYIAQSELHKSKIILQHERAKNTFLGGVNCRTRRSGIVECEIMKSTKASDYRTNEVLKIEAGLVFKDTKEARDIYVIVRNDIQSSLSLEKNGKALSSSFDMYNAIRLISSFRIFPDEIDLLVLYFRDMIRYLMDARVPGYQWKSPKVK